MRHIVTAHLIPNTLTPVIVSVALGVPGAMFAEAGLSFLGLGIASPAASWGQLIGLYQGYIQTAWHLTVFPALVLALTLPFLLDGEASPARVEPDGDAAKRMEWNLLLGRYDDRLGYTWIEFGRLEHGSPRFATLICGLRAARGRGLAQRWFAVTDQRVGSELFLQASTGQALTRDRLREAIGHRGEVFDTATRYRAAVDNRLFKLGAHRYEALVDLLIQLRKPQLSRQLDEEALSAALSEALPPLPSAVIGDVAEAFRTLEADRDDLAAFEAAAEATRAFPADYSRYAAVAVRRRAQGVTSAHASYETTQRKLRAAETERAAAERELAQVIEQRDAADRAQRAAAEAVRTLERSPEMRSARELERARSDADDARRTADQAAADVERAERVLAAFAALRGGAPRSGAGRTAPPHGLCLAGVGYGGRAVLSGHPPSTIRG